MLTNEQRAHDLAMLMLKDLKDSKLIEASRSKIEKFDPLNFKFNHYEEYIALYNEVLGLFNNDS